MQRISTNPDDYRFKSIARKTDTDGNKFWSLLGAVGVPLEIDTQEETSEADDCRNMCWEWVASGRKLVDLNHNYKDIPGAVPVEAALARKNDPDFTEGTFFARINVYDASIGEKIDKGEINGFSWAGPVDREKGLALVKHPIEGSGFTEKADTGPFPEHDHEVKRLEFTDGAKIVPTMTEISFGHAHPIVGTTRTEQVLGHAHGLRLVEGPE